MMPGRDELRRVLPIAGAYALILASLYVLKPARNALFLGRIGVDRLPWVLILVALVGGVAAALYGRYATKVRTDRLIVRTYLAMILMLIGFRLVIPFGGGWVYYAFYVWVALYGLLTTSLIWLLANSAFTPREARRVFGFIGTGGIAGAIAGGAATGGIVSAVGTENLLIVCVGLIAIALVLLSGVPSIEQPEKRRKKEQSTGLEAIVESKLLSSIALTAGLIAVVAVIVDIQFNEIVDRAFPDEDEKTAFFGSFFAYLSGFGFVFQLLLTPWILRSLGVGVAILILPVTMGLGSAAIILYPGLIAGILAKGADGGFRHSVHRAGSEVLFLPVPADVKKQTKLFLDTTVDTSATGLGAFLVLLLTGTLGLAYHELSIVVVALTAAVFFMARRMRRAYVDAFRQALESERIDLSELRADVMEAGAIATLLPLLDGTNERQVLYVLDLLSTAKSKLLMEKLVPLLDHVSPEVRRRALIALANQPGDPAAFERMLSDPDESVRTEAMVHLCRLKGPGVPEAHLSDPQLLASALGCIARVESPEVKRLLTPQLAEKIVSSGEERMRAIAARAIASTGAEALRPHLEGLTRDPSPRVVIAAIEGIGAARDRAFVPYLMEALIKTHVRRPARQALAKFGKEIVPELRRAMASDGLALARTVARLLGEIGDQSAIDLLLEHVDAQDPVVRANVARALSKLHLSHPKLAIDRDRITAAVIVEAKKLYHLAQILEVLPPDEARASSKLLRRALVEKRQRVLERIFVLLGLRHQPKDLENAYHGFMSGKAQVRASALEYLDNLLKKKLRDHVLPLLEKTDNADVVAAGRELFGEPIESRDAALAHLIAGDDAWLRACALYDLPEDPPDSLVRLAVKATSDRDPIARETASSLIARRAWSTA
jgi:AAA family ATP:ADP antiporter